MLPVITISVSLSLKRFLLSLNASLTSLFARFLSTALETDFFDTDMSAETKALIDRMGFVSGSNGGLFVRKVGAAAAAVRRGGGVHVFDSINHFFQISQMILVGSTYWNLGVGREKGEVADDQEGMNNMQNLGENMAWILKKINQ